MHAPSPAANGGGRKGVTQRERGREIGLVHTRMGPPVQGTSTIPDAALQALRSQHNERMPSALGATGPDFGDRTPVDVIVTCPL